MAAVSAGTTGPYDGSAGPIGTVLLVEDNMLIALDTEDALLDAGVERVAIVVDGDEVLVTTMDGAQKVGKLRGAANQ